MADIAKEIKIKSMAEMSKSMISKPAPDFVLRDLNGKTVSLSSLKGKLVVLDFWATWCVPCKKSFPAMLRAQKKFPNVRFLFIDTWEHGDAIAAVKSYIKESKYPFEILMDLRDPQTGDCDVVKRYEVTGIPTKFIIDKEGNIRFKVTGMKDGEDAAVDEISAMIELAAQGR